MTRRLPKKTPFSSCSRAACAWSPDNPLDGAGVYVWAGEVVLVTPGGSYIVAIQQAAIIARDTGKPVPILRVPEKVLENPVPRPDGVPVDMEKTFQPEVEAGAPGLYVTVHDGHVILAMDGQQLDLGSGETGFSSVDILSRLPAPPAFLNGDNKQLDPTGSGIQEQKGGGGIPEGGCKL
jgi:hypothetical protein